MPKISICVPAYNAAKYLPETLDGLISQTFPDYEIVITDNCSTDNTEEIVRQYMEKSDKIRFFKNEKNVGAIPNFNRAFSHCTGEYVNFFSADDVMLPQSLEVRNKILDENPSFGMVASSCPIIDSNSKYLMEGCSFSESRFIPAREYITSAPGKGLEIYIQSVLFRRSALTASGLWNEIYSCAADFDLLLRIALEYDFYIDKGVYTNYRVHSQSETNRIAVGDRVSQVLAIWSAIIDRLGLSGQALEECETKAMDNLFQYLVYRPVYMGVYFEAMIGINQLNGWRGKTYSQALCIQYMCVMHHQAESRYKETVKLKNEELKTLLLAIEKFKRLRKVEN